MVNFFPLGFSFEKTSFEALEMSFEALEYDFKAEFRKKSARDGDPIEDGDPTGHPMAIGVVDKPPCGLGVAAQATLDGLVPPRGCPHFVFCFGVLFSF